LLRGRLLRVSCMSRGQNNYQPGRNLYERAVRLMLADTSQTAQALHHQCRISGS